jgi:N-methylhydantoinase A
MIHGKGRAVAEPGSERLRIAVDVGGTFTDCVTLGDRGTRIDTKALTTPDDPSRGVFDCLLLAAADAGVSLEELVGRTRAFVHGTTVGTNALVERRGARTGLLMTRGHEETLLIGRVRQKVSGLSERDKSHVTHLRKAHPPIVHPLDVRPVTERVDAAGQVVVPLDLAAATVALDELVERGIESLAVVLLWSFVNREHEDRLAELVTARHPGLYVVTSSDIAPVLGEYERCVSTVMNAYLGPVVSGYLSTLETELKRLGLPGSLLVMQANGGVTSVAGVRGRPLLTVDSGPAGGVLGGAHQARGSDFPDVICADVGGTTFDVGLVHGGQVQMDQTPVVDQYEYALPKVYVKSIGAGGGSIAWLDPAGSLRVGPMSAGSAPGPACYGHGGLRPTVTDAHVVLGYLDPEFALGGQVRLDTEAAHKAIATLAEPLGMSVPEVAGAIAAVANAQMADLVRRVTVERGLDPRDFAIFAYGGAGPVFAAFLAQQIGSSFAYVPDESGVFSAFGMLTTDPVVEEQLTALMRLPLDDGDQARLDRIYEDLDERVRARFAAAGFDHDAVTVRRSAAMRFSMQVHELEVEVPSDRVLDADAAGAVEQRFRELYERTYGAGSALPGARVELARFASTGTIALGQVATLPRATPAAPAEPAGPATREALFDLATGFVPAAVYRGESLAPGQVLAGPAIVQRTVDTVVVPPGAAARVDGAGGLVIRWGEDGGQA